MWYELGEVAQIGTGYPFRGRIEDDPVGDLTVLQQKDISDLAKMDPERLTEIIPTGAARVVGAGTFHRHMLMPDDVLLQMRGGQFLSVVFAGNYPAIAAQGVAVIRPNERLLPRFLCWFLSHPRTTEKLRSVSGGTHIPFISKKALVNYSVPVPPIDQQNKVIEAHDICQRHRAATQRLIELNDVLVDAITWHAATQEK